MESSRFDSWDTQEVAQEREYVGPAGWSFARRAPEVGSLFRSRVTVRTEFNWMQTRETVIVRAAGERRHLRRLWRRLDEIADASQHRRAAAGRWSLRAVATAIWQSIGS